MNEEFIRLTNAVYKLLEFFPESDPLKYRAKDKALLIMEHLVLINEASGWTSFQNEKIKSQLSEDIETLLGYFWIAKSQGWLNSVNYLIISNEYENIKKDLKPITIELTKKLPFGNLPFSVISAKAEIQSETNFLDSRGIPLGSVNDISPRQQKIIDFLEKNEKAQVMDLQTVLPDITKRTIRRDLDELLASGKIIRQGDFNQVAYKLNGIGQVKTA